MRERLRRMTREERRLLREYIKSGAVVLGGVLLALSADAWVEWVLRCVGVGV